MNREEDELIALIDLVQQAFTMVSVGDMRLAPRIARQLYDAGVRAPVKDRS